MNLLFLGVVLIDPGAGLKCLTKILLLFQSSLFLSSNLSSVLNLSLLRICLSELLNVNHKCFSLEMI
jgi:hypothetical protein